VVTNDDVLIASHDRDRSGDPKEAQILAAAREAFLELGYAKTSMDTVAQRARASKTTLYTRFPSKEVLFAAVISEECRRRGMDFTPAEFAGIEPDAALREIGRRFLDLILSSEALRMDQIVTGEAARFPEVASTFRREGPERVIAAVACYFSDGAARGVFAAEDPQFLAGQFLTAVKGMLHEECMMGLREPPTADERTRFIARAVDLFLRGARPR
jgi:TetR/AcrR family transcriptional regulator, mexJK operon transcriptional repressor